MFITSDIRTRLITVAGMCAFAIALSGTSIFAQTVGPARQPGPATLVVPERKGPGHVIGRTDLYCAGYIQANPVLNGLEIVGGEKEDERHTYTQGDNIYINSGSNQSVRVGEEFSIIRPRGRFKTRLTNKKGSLGTFTQEVGRVQVTELRANVSIAVVTRACEMIVMGDLLGDVPPRVGPLVRPDAPLPHFGEANGKQLGRIVLAADSRESPSRDDIVYIDLGAEDKIKQGDYFTVYRKPGFDNVAHFREDEVALNTKGFQSHQFKGGEFSNQTRRPRNPNGSPGVSNPAISEDKIKSYRPSVPRRVVGELLVLNVKERTATAIVTRSSVELHTGDYVELQ